MQTEKSKLLRAFYVLLFLTVVVRFLPIEWLISTYSPTTLGWIWTLGLLPATAITFFLLLFRDIKRHQWRALGFHSLILCFGVTAVALHWLFIVPMG